MFQAQSVLQGRSRTLIIRELQRTNLDVNLAVNNLLSRDEEDGDDGDDGQDNYVPEDLVSVARLFNLNSDSRQEGDQGAASLMMVVKLL